MKFYSEKLNSIFDSREECLEAEEKHEQKVAEEKAKKEALTAERAKRAKEVEELYTAAVNAKKAYDDALKAFLKDYGAFHATFRSADPFFSLFDLF
jgi:hypothetical protein